MENKVSESKGNKINKSIQMNLMIFSDLRNNLQKEGII